MCVAYLRRLAETGYCTSDRGRRVRYLSEARLELHELGGTLSTLKAEKKWLHDGRTAARRDGRDAFIDHG